ncbi:hypothetical protein ABZS95_10325 [Streptomyces sp. NPDC005479]|uniref:hypothetical protein n=1 Tax=Streptomyces sp. NPDC005479 TaxID=3154879 RepID=UPI0033B535D3
MSDPYRTVVRAVEQLTTQVRRVADAMATPVVEQPDASTATPAGLRARIADALEQADYRQDMRRGDLADSVLPVVAPELARLRAELAAIRRALDPDDILYIDETVDEQFRLKDKIEEQRRLLACVLRLRDAAPDGSQGPTWAELDIALGLIRKR